MKMAKWLPCQTAVASFAYFSLADSILAMQVQAALLTDWIAPTVASETAPAECSSPPNPPARSS